MFTILAAISLSFASNVQEVTFGENEIIGRGNYQEGDFFYEENGVKRISLSVDDLIQYMQGTIPSPEKYVLLEENIPVYFKSEMFGDKKFYAIMHNVAGETNSKIFFSAKSEEESIRLYTKDAISSADTDRKGDFFTSNHSVTYSRTIHSDDNYWLSLLSFSVNSSGISKPDMHSCLDTYTKIVFMNIIPPYHCNSIQNGPVAIKHMRGELFGGGFESKIMKTPFFQQDLDSYLSAVSSGKYDTNPHPSIRIYGPFYTVEGVEAWYFNRIGDHYSIDIESFAGFMFTSDFSENKDKLIVRGSEHWITTEGGISHMFKKELTFSGAKKFVLTNRVR